MSLQTALRFSHELLTKQIRPGDNVLDATIGNGHDTLFLAQLVGATGKVFGFDIQPQAIAATRQRLQEAGASEQVTLFCQGHETLAQVIPESVQLQGAIFNLGYLPRGDKQIVTQANTTIDAVKQLLPRLSKHGLLPLVLYSGHEEGFWEKQEILTFAKQLPQEEFAVLSYQFLNQRNEPPSLLVIEKK